MADEQKIVVEIPSDRTPYAPMPQQQTNKIEEFRQGWINAIAIPGNLPDLVFDITASITIPALVSSCWASFPLPNFMRVGGAIAFVIMVLVLWQLLAIPELQRILAFRLALATVGVVLGL
ncbi:hypothetical protein [Tolypothrix sp. PCC 7601]|uniref:hypothetical protein n=1 Tax=Tolypothrix sp. PCC 7601 TaxID=1188 RepID=UPI0005EAB18B|nr:hypothetical protein [Tolypothrix sp. PCC 7601]EKE98977.1 hypothetical protein FDUTEX481_03165 [Tolypothrix sp. PCC 7601]UYD35659.1 hypothetical protein HG267_07820 [Tolypothrix sp. PCC 7601]BAY94777.1 hypothetical protein NIES3275_68310 [Microchaete diplosiphon NIES-3275]